MPESWVGDWGPVAVSTVDKWCKDRNCPENFAFVLLLCRKIFANAMGCFAHYCIFMLLPIQVSVLPGFWFSLISRSVFPHWWSWTYPRDLAMMLVSVGHRAGRRPQEMVQLVLQPGVLCSCVPLLCTSDVGTHYWPGAVLMGHKDHKY